MALDGSAKSRGDALGDTFKSIENLTGSKLSDKLTGDAGDNKISGLGGNDQISGKAGNDVFEFDGTAFGGLAMGALAANQFQSSVAANAKTADVRFLYETDTGILRFNADGNGSGAAVVIATLQPGATMTIDDIVII